MTSICIQHLSILPLPFSTIFFTKHHIISISLCTRCFTNLLLTPILIILVYILHGMTESFTKLSAFQVFLLTNITKYVQTYLIIVLFYSKGQNNAKSQIYIQFIYSLITDKNVNTTIATIYEINTLINFR